MSLAFTIITFLIILAALILVHEFGHFIFAKMFGIRVDEFGLGFPPEITSFKKGETKYAINSLPLGGYVKIFGETIDDDAVSGPDSSRSFVNKSKWIQASVLVAGIFFNILFAFILFTIGSLSGLPASADTYTDTSLKNIHLSLTEIKPKSPAEKAGMHVGDVLLSVKSGDVTLTGNQLTPDAAQQLISGSAGQSIEISYSDSGVKKDVTLQTVSGIVEGKPAVGIAMSLIGTEDRLSIGAALWRATKLTEITLQEVIMGLYGFFSEIFIGHPDFSQVSGFVGIAGQVGDASRFGFAYLLSFAALISLNLAVINFIPFPALDGGRLLFILIEAVRGKSIKARTANIVNSVGFALLILLMIVITYHDIAKLIYK